MSDRYQVLIKDQFESIHSLKGNEEPHSHRFYIEVVYSGELFEGKVLDLQRAKRDLHNILEPLDGVYLNQFEGVPQLVRDFPTCESLCFFVKQRIMTDFLPHYQKSFPGLDLDQISTELYNENEKVYFGAARWSKI